MSLLREAPVARTPTLARASNVRLVQAAPALWRIIGHHSRGHRVGTRARSPLPSGPAAVSG